MSSWRLLKAPVLLLSSFCKSAGHDSRATEPDSAGRNLRQPRSLAILCLMRYEDWTFREAEVRLGEHRELRQVLGLVRVPEFHDSVSLSATDDQTSDRAALCGKPGVGISGMTAAEGNRGPRSAAIPRGAIVPSSWTGFACGIGEALRREARKGVLPVAVGVWEGGGFDVLDWRAASAETGSNT